MISTAVVPPQIRSLHGKERNFSTEAQSSRELVRDLHQPRPDIYWSDLLFTALFGWAGFAGACLFPAFSVAMLACTAVAVAGLYRGLCFVHEISHLNARILRGFEAVWNVVFGYTLLMPSFVYCGVHQSHHKLSTYGTKLDPEYMAFSQSSRMTVIFALQSIFIPVLLLIRFLILTPIGVLHPLFQRLLVIYASSLTMNLEYRRESSAELVHTIRWQSSVIWLIWMGALSLAVLHILPWRVFGVWLLVSAIISFVNTLRTLGAHTYESEGEALDREGQLLDSIDTPGQFWTELWAPVGLRYHALHHYFPGIPYHNLGQAYRRLVASLPHDATYHDVHSPSLRSSLSSLYQKGRSRRGQR